MKQRWTPDELTNYWTLTSEETELVNKTSKTAYNRIGLPVVMEKKTTFRNISVRKHTLVIGEKGNWHDIMFNSILQNDRRNSDTL